MCRDRHAFFRCEFCVWKVFDQYHVLLCRRFWTFKQGFLEIFVVWFSEHKGWGGKGHLDFFPKFIYFVDATRPLLNMMLSTQNPIPGKKKSKKRDLVATYLVKVIIGLSSFLWESKYLRIRVTSFHISGFQVWEIHQVAASREMWNSNIARFVTDVQCQSLSPFSCDGRVPGLSPPKSIGVGGCLLLLLPLPNPKASILPKVTRDSAFTLVSLITNECHDVNEEWGAWTQKGVNKELVEPKKMVEG